MQYPQKAGIYLLRNKINNKVYIGKAQDINYRMYGHKNDKRQKGRPIVDAIKKYGWKNFEVRILELTGDMPNEEILFRESLWIKFYRSTDMKIGYNIIKYGTDSTGCKRSRETIKKQQETLKKNGTLRKGESHPNWGKKHSQEILEKISQTQKKNGKYSGKNNPNYGKRHSEENRKKISEKLKDRDYSFLKHKQTEKHKEKTRLSREKYYENRPKGSLKRPVKQIDPITNKVIKIWESIKEASIGISGKKFSHIGKVCNKVIYTTAFGYKWEYA